MEDKLKVGDRVLHVSGANIDGYDGMEGEILRIEPEYMNTADTHYVIGFKKWGNAITHVWCYNNPITGTTLDLQLLHPLQGENG